jgi:hypothetical protein
LLIIAYHFLAQDALNIAGPAALGTIRAAEISAGGMEAARAARGSGYTSQAFVPVALYGLYVFGTSLVARMEGLRVRRQALPPRAGDGDRRADPARDRARRDGRAPLGAARAAGGGRSSRCGDPALAADRAANADRASPYAGS